MAAGGRLTLLRSFPNLAVGAALTVLLLLAAGLSLAWSPYPPGAIDVPHRLAPMSAAHWLGTDALGRDMATQILVGAQSSVAAGVVAVGIGVALGVTLGLAAAAEGGLVEEIVMRLADVTFAFPAVLSAIMLTQLFGAGLFNAVLAIGIFNVPVFARVTRAAAKAVWQRDFILAARVAGRGGVGISIAHVLPNILPILVVQATIQFAAAILAEAALSYLGLGTQPPQPSWGRMLNDAQSYLLQAPRLAIVPGVAIALAVLGLNLLGDGLNDIFDPRPGRRR